jgi:hypothetical protein
MRFLVALLFLATLLSARSYTVAQVKSEYQRVQNMIKNGDLKVQKKSFNGGLFSGSIKLYTDKRGVARFLVKEGGSEGNSHKAEYTYDRRGKLIFTYNRDRNTKRCEMEIRSYYSGKRVLDRKRETKRCNIKRVQPLREDNPKKAFREFQA